MQDYGDRAAVNDDFSAVNHLLVLRSACLAANGKTDWEQCKLNGDDFADCFGVHVGESKFRVQNEPPHREIVYPILNGG